VGQVEAGQEDARRASAAAGPYLIGPGSIVALSAYAMAVRAAAR